MARKKRGISTRGAKVVPTARATKAVSVSTRAGTRGGKKGIASKRGKALTATTEESNVVSDGIEEMPIIDFKCDEMVIVSQNDHLQESNETEPASQDLKEIIGIQDAEFSMSITTTSNTRRTRSSKRNDQTIFTEEFIKEKNVDLNQYVDNKEQDSSVESSGVSPVIQHKKFRKFKKLLSKNIPAGATENEIEDSILTIEAEKAFKKQDNIIEEEMLTETVSEVTLESDTEIIEGTYSEIEVEPVPDVLVEETVTDVEIIGDDMKSMDVDENSHLQNEETNESEISTQLSILTVNSTDDYFTITKYQSDSEQDIEDSQKIIIQKEIDFNEIIGVNRIKTDREQEMINENVTEIISDPYSEVGENASLEIGVVEEANQLVDIVAEKLQFTSEDTVSVKEELVPERVTIEEIANIKDNTIIPETLSDDKMLADEEVNSVNISAHLENLEEIENKSETINETKQIAENVEKELKIEETNIDANSKIKLKLENSSRSTNLKVSKVPTKAQLKSMELPKLSNKPSKKERKTKKEKTEKAEIKPIEKEDSNVRRSSRIKSISVLKKSSKGRGLVKIKNQDIDLKDSKFFKSKINSTDSDAASENSNSGHADIEKVPLPLDSPSFVSPNGDPDVKPVKVKSRWRRSSELEMGGTSPNPSGSKSSSPQTILESIEESSLSQTSTEKMLLNEDMELRLKQFIHLKENQYLTERLSCKEAKKMVCDCFLTEEETERGEYGCGEDCLNRLLMIECGNLCVVRERCTNKRFQKMQYSPCEVFVTEKKGCGIRATANIPYGEFILEYVGEVLDSEEFDRRAKDYSEDKNKHYYFMALRADTIIDATQKGNISRFINHSCEPNAETQKWTVNGELRIGFFSTRTILAGEEITFDYQFQRYGKEAQKCFCEAPTCRGWIGEEPDDDEDEEDEEEEEEEEPDVQDKEVSERKEVAPDGEEVVEKIVSPPKKKGYPKRNYTRKPRKEIFEDADLGEEIEMLCTTGLKNQAHTLKLSRLMVRAKEPTQRMQLLRLIRHGELPCRRLFLDYHGLRLMHGWMGDIPNMPKTNQLDEAFCLEMLQTLAVLPIPNKTMLQDSKVLQTVEKWSVLDKKTNESSSDSCSNSPNIEVCKEEKNDNDNEAPRITATKEPENALLDVNSEVIETQLLIMDEIVEGGPSVENMEIEVKTEEFVEMKTEIKVEVLKKDYIGDIVHLAIKLLEEWLILKEVFRIPKKERIEQMKEHEREADRGYKAGLGLEQESGNERKSNRYRSVDVRKIEKVDTERYRKGIKIDDRNYLMMPRMSKYERRKLFQMKVEQEEADRRRKQQEMWRQHEQNCMMMGTDPRFTAPYDPNRGYQCFWNAQTGQWQNFTPNVQNQPPMFIVPQPPPMVQQNNQFTMMQPHHQNPPMSNMPPSMAYQGAHPQQLIAVEKEIEDPSQVKFMGPIPPPVKMPPKWKCAKDKYGRPYYYHIKIRKAQWEPPLDVPLLEELPDPELIDTSSSSESSSLSSDTSSESEDEDELDDTKLLLEIRQKLNLKKLETVTKPKLQSSLLEDLQNEERESEETIQELPPQTSQKRKREGLVQEIIISPRREEDRLQFKEDVKRYKETKEKLKRQKEQMLEQSRKIKSKSSKQSTKNVKRHKSSSKSKQKAVAPIDINSEAAKKMKEMFRSSMAGVMVGILNAYRKPDCKQGKITNTEDFKHLARKLTHFVMLKELKHCQDIQELVCTDSVKAKAKEFVRKYMSKFGEVYIKPKDDLDNY